jgi:adenosylmethionine-8-amino-7-oxononanoate aminotransferase
LAKTIRRIGVGTSRQNAGRFSRQGAKKDLTPRRKDAKVEEGEERWARSGTIEGVRGDHVLLAPPFIAADAELKMIVERLKGAVDAATKDK